MRELRKRGHDVLTSFDAGNANDAVPDASVLAFASTNRRILLTLNRRHFLRLHGEIEHAGIVLCTFDPDFAGQAARIQAAVSRVAETRNWLVRVNRPG